MCTCKCSFAVYKPANCSCTCHLTTKATYTGVATVYVLDVYKRCRKMGYDKRAAIEMSRWKRPTENPPPMPEFIQPIKKEMA
jgi:hypothetical protein